MEAKEAIKRAIEYVADVFEPENPKNIGLEEITLDERYNEWKVTVGFSRPWDYPSPSALAGEALPQTFDACKHVKRF
uniref:Uncharacterized protein n=1 Tax=Candidatus Kentrum sp. MB TaxID=2138164 RepID=A0A451BBK4_9GAMM|nr:MAG: hypothetical protein BECKMB1821G_GA0114241_102838 [Candidatus Kentron sp. MB]VFK32086.1 MAG: hypothetical protein BECKMB1821I_GA0114274_102937 [Candidatus Kentron sp. MB]VFK75648.1 MAG: hypothetical protein BECKMB1821H_GA0114242_102811 [Candidatus Kentron sp. MB]